MSYIWFGLRVLFVGFWAHTGWTGMDQGLESDRFPLSFASVLGTLAIGALVTRYWVARPYFDRGRSQTGSMPSWSANPFQSSQPFQAMHTGGIAFVAMGAMALIRGPRNAVEATSPHMPSELFGASFGLGILVGIYWTMRSHPNLFRRPAGDA